MARVILKSNYTKTLTHALNNLDYVNSREGVVTDSKSQTHSQKNYIKALEKGIKNSDYESLPSYSVYQDKTTKENASIYISDLEVLFENNLSPTEYIQYISDRGGSQGLFDKNGMTDSKIAKKNITDFKNEHKYGNVYMHVIALTGDDARANGYDKLENWQLLLNKVMPEFAKAHKIDLKNLDWYAAMHDHKNPHVHLTMFDKTNKAYLNKKQFTTLRKLLAKEIYHEEMHLKATDFYQSRKALEQEVLKIDEYLNDDQFINSISNIKELVNNHTGKMTYAYLDVELKAKLNDLLKYMVTSNTKAKDLFLETTYKSKDYTEFYTKDDGFVEDFLYPGKTAKKHIHNKLLEFINNYDTHEFYFIYDENENNELIGFLEEVEFLEENNLVASNQLELNKDIELNHLKNNPSDDLFINIENKNKLEDLLIEKISDISTLAYNKYLHEDIEKLNYSDKLDKSINKIISQKLKHDVECINIVNKLSEISDIDYKSKILYENDLFCDFNKKVHLSIKNNYDLFLNKVENIKIAKSVKKQDLIKDKLIKKLNDIDLSKFSDEDKHLFYKFIAYKNIHINVLNKELTNFDETYYDLRKIELEASNYFDFIDNNEFIKLNDLLDMETRQVYTNRFESVYTDFLNDFDRDISICNNYDHKFSTKNYKLCSKEEKNLINGIVHNIVSLNLDKFNSYFEEMTKLSFLRQNEIEHYPTFRDKNMNNIILNYVNGYDNTRIHQFILKSINNKDFEPQLNKIQDVKAWYSKFNFKKDKIDFSNELYNNPIIKNDMINKLSIIAKAYFISNDSVNDLSTILKSVMENHKEYFKDLFHDEIITSVLKNVAEEKTIADLNNKPLSLNTKERSFLLSSSNYREFNQNAQPKINSPIPLGLITIIKSFNMALKSNNEQPNRSNNTSNKKKKKKRNEKERSNQIEM